MHDFMTAFIGGAKGGVGKSLVAMLLLHFYNDIGKNPILIDTDDANTDVYRCYHDICESYAHNIDKDKGLEKALNVVSSASGPVVINSGARNLMFIERYGKLFNYIDNFVTLWVINHQLDSLNLLNKYLNVIHKPVCVVKNGVSADPEDFEKFNSIFGSRLPSVYLPKAPDGLIHMLYMERKPIQAIADESFGVRLMVEGWISDAMSAIEQALSSAKVFEEQPS